MGERLFGSFTPPQGLGACPKPTARDCEQQDQTWDNGGTGHLLPRERLNASFDVLKMTSGYLPQPKSLSPHSTVKRSSTQSVNDNARR